MYLIFCPIYNLNFFNVESVKEKFPNPLEWISSGGFTGITCMTELVRKNLNV